MVPDKTLPIRYQCLMPSEKHLFEGCQKHSRIGSVHCLELLKYFADYIFIYIQNCDKCLLNLDKCLLNSFVSEFSCD